MKTSQVKSDLITPASRIRRRILRDRIDPKDIRKYKPQLFCENCVHYSLSKKKCSLDYPALHTKKEQMAIYERTGHMAMCRALEIE